MRKKDRNKVEEMRAMLSSVNFTCSQSLFKPNPTPYSFKIRKRWVGEGGNETTAHTHTHTGFLSLLGIWARPAVLWLSAAGLLTCQSDG